MSEKITPTFCVAFVATIALINPFASFGSEFIEPRRAHLVIPRGDFFRAIRERQTHPSIFEMVKSCPALVFERNDADGATALHILATFNEHQQFAAEHVLFLIQQGAPLRTQDFHGYTPLQRAAQCGNTRVIRVLLAAGADTTVLDQENRTLLHLAALSDSPATIHTLLQKCPTMIEHKDSNGQTPLHIAAHHGKYSIVLKLIELGADINTQAHNGYTPYYTAIREAKLDVALLLFDAGADSDQPWAADDEPVFSSPETRDRLMQGLSTLDVINFYRARRHRSRKLSGNIQRGDHIQIQAEAGSAIINFLNDSSIYELTQLPRVLNTLIVSYLISPDAAEHLQINPTRLQTIIAWFRRNMMP